ncbi:MAG: hypothetical protein ABSA94_20760, partial [Acidobacteriaceae bacterium]
MSGSFDGKFASADFTATVAMGHMYYGPQPVMSRADWKETTATVYSCGWQETPWRILDFGLLGDLFSGRYLIVFSYSVDGANLSGEFTSSKELKEGSTFPLSYDSANPEKNDRNSGVDGSWFNFAAWVVAILLGALFV